MGAGQSAKALQKRAVCSGGGRRWKRLGRKRGPESKEKSNVAHWLRLGRGGPSGPWSHTSAQLPWQSPECCQRARMNRGDLFLSRCALPEQGVQREWLSTITNGQKLVLMFRLPQIIFF